MCDGFFPPNSLVAVRDHASRFSGVGQDSVFERGHTQIEAHDNFEMTQGIKRKMDEYDSLAESTPKQSAPPVATYDNEAHNSLDN